MLGRDGLARQAVRPTPTGEPPCAMAIGAHPVDPPNSTLYCAELVPTPDLRGAAGIASIAPAISPFGIAVTAEGHVRYAVRLTIEGLPPPSSLGDFTTYVAWAVSLTLDREIKLGEVGNGRHAAGEVFLNQFRIFVSAEKDARVTGRTGRLVMRGTSPSARLLAHRDLMQPSATITTAPQSSRGSAFDSFDKLRVDGEQRRTVEVDRTADHSSHAHAAADGAWVMPPMDASFSTMMPGMDHLVPSVAPYRPGAGVDLATIPEARPREIVRLTSGATLDLEAGLVRRTIGAKRFVMFAFNGQHPGPLIDVPQNATIVVRFTNRLDMPSAVHWHGIRLENRFDGAPGVTQDPVPPGGTFIYRIHFRDAGLYWYHPHVREDIQQDLGLAGNMLVRSSDAAHYGPANREEVLMLDDLLAGADTLIPHGSDAPTHALIGRFGNVILVNGEPSYELNARRGDVVRFFLTNASSARIYNVSFGGAPIKLIASDVSRFEREQRVDSIVLAPAERYIVDVRFPNPGGFAITNRIQALDHMAGVFRAETHTLGTVRVSSDATTADHRVAFETLRVHDEEIARYRRFIDKPVDRELHLTVRTQNLPPAVTSMFTGAAVPVDWNDGMPHANWLATGREVIWTLREPSTGRENMHIEWSLRQDDVIKLRLFNDPSSVHPMDHPVHIHGQRFLVVKRNGVANGNLAWKDTVVVGAGETVDLLLELSNPGRWMVHCHIAEHLGTGMMMVMDVQSR